MEDQGKKLLLTVGIICAIMFGWQLLFPPKKPEEKKPPPAEVSAPTPPVATPPVATPPVATRAPVEEVVLENPQFRATFSTRGGTLTSWQLLGRQFHVAGGARPEDMVRSTDPRLRPFLVSFPDSTHALAADSDWTLAERSATGVVFRQVVGPLEVTKRFTVHPTDFLVDLTVGAALAGGNAKQHLVLSLGGVQDPNAIDGGKMGQAAREWKAECYANESLSAWTSKTLAGKSKEVGGQVGWFGFNHPYFLTAIALEPSDERVTCRATGITPEAGPMMLEALYAPAVVEAGKPLRRKVTGYFGPKYMSKLSSVSSVVGWKDTGLEKAIDLGWLGFIAGPLLWLLNFFHGLTGNWPLSIVLMTIAVKLATLYWTHKSMKSMKEMARLRPELDALKEKYKDDRQRQQVETMNLFKSHGVNPLAGCLPMLLQMPIWFAFYRALSVAAELYHAPFLWIHDLTAADPYFVLPVVMTGMMLAQAVLTPTTASGMQQKMMTWGMPIMFGAMSLFFPAGLTLYTLTNSFLTLVHHFFMRQGDRKVAARAAAPAAAAPAVIDAAASEVVDDGDAEADAGVDDGPDAASGPRKGGPRKGGPRKKKGGRRR
jgi:YidC/Oxa1 family membrane protein insertase